MDTAVDERRLVTPQIFRRGYERVALVCPECGAIDEPASDRWDELRLGGPGVVPRSTAHSSHTAYCAKCDRRGQRVVMWFLQSEDREPGGMAARPPRLEQVEPLLAARAWEAWESARWERGPVGTMIDRFLGRNGVAGTYASYLALANYVLTQERHPLALTWTDARRLRAIADGVESGEDREYLRALAVRIARLLPSTHADDQSEPETASRVQP